MKKRIITATILTLILLPAVVVPVLKPIFELIVFLFTIVASFEILNMYDKKKHVPMPIKIICVILTIGLYSSVVNNFKSVCYDTLICKFIRYTGVEIDVFLTMGLIFLTLMACLVFVHDFDASDVGKCLVQIIYVGLCFACFTVLRSYGVRFIVYLLIITVSTDVFALVFGLTIGKKIFGGRHKMAPYISPNKSWEGAIGGTAIALIIGVTFLVSYPYFTSSFHGGEVTPFFEGVFEYEQFTQVGLVLFMIVLTLFMSVCSQIGDLVASKLKRTYGIKDYSNIFPGHGGVLDRFDSAIFASAIFLVLIQLEAITYPIIGNLGI